MRGRPPVYEQHEDARGINALGGTTAVSKLCEVSLTAVSVWKRRGIPKPWKKYLDCLMK